MKALILWFNTTGSPPNFERFAARWIPIWFTLAFLCLLIGSIGGLFLVPADSKQGEIFRIIYIHVPAAWMSLFVFIAMAVQAFIALVWRIKISELLTIASAHIGLIFTVITLITGSIWGKPTWGTWWTWDPRLTSELVLLFIYLGIIGLYNAIEDRRSAARAAAFLVLIGIINVPIVHFSVSWWNTLHQGETIRLVGESKMATELMWPLVVMTLATKFWFLGSVLKRTRAMNLEHEAGKDWARELAGADQ
ncbi:MAG: heme ABC transporter permease CcmC [Arenimonas sp.]